MHGKHIYSDNILLLIAFEVFLRNKFLLFFLRRHIYVKVGRFSIVNMHDNLVKFFNVKYFNAFKEIFLQS